MDLNSKSIGLVFSKGIAHNIFSSSELLEQAQAQ
jgi:hypothetical protein